MMGMKSNENQVNSSQDKGQDQLSKIYGIKIESINLTMRGGMIDLRYRIVDTKAAKQVVTQHSKIDISLIDKKSGQVIKVAESDIGKLMARSPRLYPNRRFFILFENPHGMVKAGSEVSIVFGSVKIDGWKIE